ncbi:hypothetical protein GTY68_00480 [Streptomyces sp. SID4926]|nr:hypothetical protein SSBG_03759 [Streptomyces sp. SPB074]EFK97979.1 conserved hypothetical protein [Streptomyces sp. SPB78]MYQ55751.1 hypothetical protein [Streptomyces sp. SID4926]
MTVVSDPHTAHLDLAGARDAAMIRSLDAEAFLRRTREEGLSSSVDIACRRRVVILRAAK